MRRRRSSSNLNSSVNHGSIVDNHGLAQQNVQSVNVSGQGDHSSSDGWIGQTSSIGSSYNQIAPVELNAGHGWLPSAASNTGTSQWLEEMHSEPNNDKILTTRPVTIGPSASQSFTSYAISEGSNRNTYQEIGVGYVNQTSRWERNTGNLERHTRRRIDLANEQGFPSLNMSSNVHVGSTSQMFQASYHNWITSPSSGSTSSISPVIPASGSNALRLEENSGYISRSTSVQSMLVPGTGRGNPSHQNLMTPEPFLINYGSQNGAARVQISTSPMSGSDALRQQGYLQNFPRNTSVQTMLVSGTERGNPGHQNLMTLRPFPLNYSSQNGTTGVQLSPPPPPPPPVFSQHNVTRAPQNGFISGVHLSSTPGFLPRNMAEEYDERLSDIANQSMMRLAGFGSGGQIGYIVPPSSASVTMRNMLESRPSNTRVIQALSRLRTLMRRAGQNNAMPPILPPLQPPGVAETIARLVCRALEVLRQVDAALQYEDGLVVLGPLFYEETEEGIDVNEDMRLNVDDMSYEELLALGEEIGDVSTGLSEEAILGAMKRVMHGSMKLGPPVEDELCCICQEDYVDGDELGKLDCGHEFHFNCIKKWLMQKNTCPICKATALAI
ncbi:E3 ubiquitin-protein ligase MBR1-like isoform X2 [Actinidia eriantha]|uniref:E3 ubiquitin-protein ligase MBR1-like isoform X2 n=1 Tax=Actinidia eriantha TaxID=165200 RepID=UPI00258E1520|nr:E3 ubiquitin-protein ligase MBR1-like isoform X2 [Actinidia eriantha]